MISTKRRLWQNSDHVFVFEKTKTGLLRVRLLLRGWRLYTWKSVYVFLNEFRPFRLVLKSRNLIHRFFKNIYIIKLYLPSSSVYDISLIYFAIYNHHVCKTVVFMSNGQSFGKYVLPCAKLYVRYMYILQQFFRTQSFCGDGRRLENGNVWNIIYAHTCICTCVYIYKLLLARVYYIFWFITKCSMFTLSVLSRSLDGIYDIK